MRNDVGEMRMVRVRTRMMRMEMIFEVASSRDITSEDVSRRGRRRTSLSRERSEGDSDTR